MEHAREAAFSDLDRSQAYQLWRANNAMQRILRRALEPLGLTPVQFIVLASTSRLGLAGERVTQAAVCRFAGLDENMLSQVVRGLEKRGLLERHGCWEDRRANLLSLSEVGESQVTKARSKVREQTEEAFDWPQGEALLSLLRSLAERLESMEE